MSENVIYGESHHEPECSLAAVNVDMNRCLAHIINLATQALISTRSKAKYYDSSTQEAELSDIYADTRDEVGLIRAICIKVRTSCLHEHSFC